MRQPVTATVRIGRAWPWLVGLVGFSVAVAAVGGLGWLAWRAAWAKAEGELVRAADAGAASALRIIEGQRLASDVINEMLHGLSDDEVRVREPDLHQRIATLVNGLPLVRSAIVVDRAGRLLVASDVSPAPSNIDFSDREWHRALSGAMPPALHVSRVSVGRIYSSPFFSVSRRRTGAGNGLPAEAYDGAVGVAVAPNAVAAAFADLSKGSVDTVSLVREDGQILVRTPGVPALLPEIPAGSPLRQAASRGELRGTYLGVTLGLGPDPVGASRLIAFRRVEGLPLYVTLARPVAVIRADWRDTMLRGLAVGLPALVAMLALGWALWRKSRAAEAARLDLLREAERREAAEAARAEAEARRQAEARFRAIFESRVVGIAVFDLNTDRVLIANARLLDMVGVRADGAAPGDGDAELDWRAVTPPEYLTLDEAAIAEGRQRGWWSPYEKEYQRLDGGRVPVRISSAPLACEPGQVVVMVQDISEQREAEARRDLLLREVDHRAKNALATARAALRLTRAASMEEFIGAVDGRIGALAQAMGVLAATGWQGAELEGLLRGELTLFAGTGPHGPMVEYAGPKVELASRAVQPLAMAVHELATNAAKYGALSVPGGLVRLSWSLEPGPLPYLVLVWRERGGPPVAGPGAAGFGSRLLTATVQRQLGGRFTAEWSPDGLTCRIQLPASLLLAGARELELSDVPELTVDNLAVK
jgi:PAS domain S-box-containing protein